MPIEPRSPLRTMAQQEFGDIAYGVVGEAFAVHEELGRFLDERVYQAALRHRLGERAQTEFPVRVWHRDFETVYALDLVVDGGAVFELKTVTALTGRHRSQLMNYLMLTETHHGKLLNFAPDRVEHAFVNALPTLEGRRQFSVRREEWSASPAGSQTFADVLVELLADWGAGLALPLYEAAVTHFLGGEEHVLSTVEVALGGLPCGEAEVRLLNPRTAFWLSCVKPDDCTAFETHLRRFLRNSSLDHIQWANITLKELTLRTLAKP